MTQSRGMALNYGISLAALLGMGMLMTALVMLMLWQRGMVREQTSRNQNALTLITGQGWSTEDLGADPREVHTRMQRILTLALKSTGALCGAVRVNKQEQIAGAKECPSEALFTTMRQASALGKPATRSTGATWGILGRGPRHIIIAIPVTPAPGQTGVAGLVLPLAPVYQSIRDSQRIVLSYLLVNLIILTAIGLFRFHTLTVRPVNRLVRLADSYRDPDDAIFPALEERSEFGRLANSLSRMLQRIEQDREKLRATVQSLELANQSLLDTQQEMVRTEKMASVGRLAAGLAHEIGNPLGIIQGYLGLLCQARISDDERKEFSRRAEKELERISTLLRQLLDLSRSLPVQYQLVSVHAILSELLPVIQAQPLAEGIQISGRFEAARHTVKGDPERLRQVFLNCLLNSIDAVRASGKKSGRITVTTETAPEAKLLVMIEDNGEGISTENLANVFDPFFTTKEPGKGTGLGLSVSLTIIEGLGGRMEIESRLGEGSRVRICLPSEEV